MTKFYQVPEFKLVCTPTYVDDPFRPIRPVKADSIVVKTLRMVLCSSHDGIPFKLKKENGRPYSLKLYIDWYHFRLM